MNFFVFVLFFCILLLLLFLGCWCCRCKVWQWRRRRSRLFSLIWMRSIIAFCVCCSHGRRANYFLCVSDSLIVCLSSSSIVSSMCKYRFRRYDIGRRCKRIVVMFTRCCHNWCIKFVDLNICCIQFCIVMLSNMNQTVCFSVVCVWQSIITTIINIAAQLTVLNSIHNVLLVQIKFIEFHLIRLNITS